MKLLLVFNLMAVASCLQSLKETELLTKLSILKHYPTFFALNVTANSSSVRLEKTLDKFLSKLKKLEGSDDHDMNCTSGDENIQQICSQIFASKCLSTKDMISLLPNNSESEITAITNLCPLLLFQTHENSCEATGKISGHKKPTVVAVWGLGILFVTIISCCSLVGVVLLPLLNKDLYHAFLMVFEGLAVGSLLSSAVFHLIPQAFNLLGEDVKHDYLWKALIIFVGVYSFFVSERLMKIVLNIRKKKSQTEIQKPTAVLCTNITTINGVIDSMNGHQSDSVTAKPYSNKVNANNEMWVGDQTRKVSLSESEVHSSSHHHNHDITFVQGRDSAIGTVAWMVILGDGFHNFIDGLSIGAAFSESILAGISISVAVLCEEFPHELGDFAVLLSAGMTMRQALIYNFLSACTCYLGLVFGILLGDLAEGSHYIFAFAGGMFIYISLVDMMRELNDALDAAENAGAKHTLKIFLLQNIGIIIGVVILFVLARYSERINFDLGSEETVTEHLTEVSKSMSNDHYNLKALYRL